MRTLLGLLKPDFRRQDMRVVRFPGQATLRVSTGHEDRAARILDALCRWLSDHNHDVSIETLPTDHRHHMFVVGRGELSFRIALVERFKQVDHVPTAKEKADAAEYSYLRPPKTDLLPSGQFVLEFLRVGQRSGVYGTWKDGRHTIEEQLGDAVLRIPRIFVQIEEEKRTRAEAARREREAEIVRAREADRKRYREELEKDLDGMIARWHHARRIREFISAVEPMLIVTAKGVGSGRRAWMAWARAYADSIDPICHPDSVAKELSPRDERGARS